jgi:hypothetical protein
MFHWGKIILGFQESSDKATLGNSSGLNIQKVGSKFFAMLDRFDYL